MKRVSVFIVLSIFIFSSCAPIVVVKKPHTYTYREMHGKPFVQIGLASYYGKKFHGKKMANGKPFNMYAFTCAHPTLPFGTKVKVTNLENGKWVIVTVTDRGPYVKNRIIDLSYAAAKEIGMIKDGVVKVKVEVVE